MPSPAVPASKTALALLLAVLALLALSGCNRTGGNDSKAKRPIPVMVAEAKTMTMPVLVQAVGNVEAFASVSIKPQISGVIAKQMVRDGQDVVKDQVLFHIDPRTYRAFMEEAQARLQKDHAQAVKAEDDLRRYLTLYEQGAVSRDLMEQMRTNAEALRASLALDRAVVEQARLQLGYAVIKAPISGRAGNVLVQEGNVVGKAGDDRVLLVINQLTPISVVFSVPEKHLPEIQRQSALGKLPVEARTGEGELLDTGELASIDNNVDKTTGTIRLKATFSNKSLQLWPGQFVRARIRLAERLNAVIVPSQAVQSGVNGQFIFVVKGDMSVEMREVATSPGGDQTLIVDKGLAPGETVVVDGQIMLVPGSLVEIKAQPADASGHQNAAAPPPQAAATRGADNATKPDRQSGPLGSPAAGQGKPQ
ncbi:MAG: efflux RND transporter periplasmic adaptor subunit [Humidesulfovibrio sp.]|uniref:efflux RND transporter periplasmic adaptor subunit n=1 Tax=Humidesulfovibrio sp. TaxID=2910988 RepID=UPI002732B1BE|nr:efflux RND transporter periplasmic adaptor subunit [Humidesulfovibrio sp.]MDP2847312.1 efflux RND transporter periplasmic adaptor subunit [Humidesulfovibrio sp.]